MVTVSISVISLTSGTIVSITNYILTRLIKYVTLYERHETYTKFNLSVALKLVLATFINTGLIPLFVNYQTKNWFTRSGLIDDIFYNTISVCFVGPLFNVINIGRIYKWIIRYIETKKGDKTKMSQRQLNALFEGPPIDISARYSSSMLLVLLSCFYVTLLPIIPVI